MRMVMVKKIQKNYQQPISKGKIWGETVLHPHTSMNTARMRPSDAKTGRDTTASAIALTSPNAISSCVCNECGECQCTTLRLVMLDILIWPGY